MLTVKSEEHEVMFAACDNETPTSSVIPGDSEDQAASSQQDSIQCQECGQMFCDIVELTQHVQENHVVKRSSTKLKTDKKSSSIKSSVKPHNQQPVVNKSQSQPSVSRVFLCNKCGCEMASSQYNETGVCTSCLVKIQLEVICDESSLMMTCESFCHSVSDVENFLDGEVFEGEEQAVDVERDVETDIQNAELEELHADSVFDVSNVTEAYAKIGSDKHVKYRCLLCPKQFIRHKSMMKHMASHVDSQHKCEVCDKEFKQSEELQEHMLTHLEQQPEDMLSQLSQQAEDDEDEESNQADTAAGNRYACGQCGKQFRHRASLFRHVETHTENLRFDCTECGKTYRHRADFQQHMRLKHLLKNLAVCRYCDRKFYLPGSLRAHLHTHRAEKSYKCRICDKVYQRSDSLNNHMLVHTGESPYMCTQCGEQFKHRLSMYRHLDSHKDRELFRCELCLRCFKHSNALREHTKRFHSAAVMVITEADVTDLVN